MKKLLLTIIIAIFLAGCSSDSSPPEELSNIAALKSKEPSKINEIRLTALKQTARSLGAQAGLAWRSKQLNTILSQQKSNLDHIFNFNYLILNSNVLPPVLAEGRNTLNLADEYSLRIADHYYQIVFPPRFITAPPTWRDYIWMAYKKPETPNSSLLPKNGDERAIWNDNIKIGWNEGVIQADEIFIANLNRLHRDYEGMVLYRKLLAQNMVTPPFVSQASLGVTGGGNDMRINDRVLRITSTPQLRTNAKTWNPVIEDEADSNATTNNNGTVKPKTKQDKI